MHEKSGGTRDGKAHKRLEFLDIYVEGVAGAIFLLPRHYQNSPNQDDP